MKQKKAKALLISAVMACGMFSAFPFTASADNPIGQTVFTPDPAPLVVGDTLYLYTGRDKDGPLDFYYMTDYQCYSTQDMQNWTHHGTVLSWKDFSWAKEDTAWAAQCVERNGKFYYYVTMENSSGGGRAIGVAVADSPTGPFKDALGQPLCGPNWDYIDPTVWIDDDGQAWLMFGNPSLYYVKLNEDMISLDGEVQKFDMSASAFGNNGNRSTYGEGPWLYKRNDLYYVLYAAFGDGNGSEDIRYSTAPSPTGPWTYRGVIMPMQGNSFTNHSGVVDYKGKSYFFYHNGALDGGGSFQRSACVEEFEYNADGTFPTINMTKEGPAQIEALDPYRRVEAETMSWSSGIETEPIDAGTQAIGFIQNGDYVKISGVDFGEAGASEFYASVASAGQGGVIELHLDSVSGPIIGTVKVPITGDWQAWETVNCEVKGATGKHDLYLRFSGGDSYLFNVDWWQFRPSGSGEFLLGDANYNGTIDAADMTIAKQIQNGSKSDIFAVKAADVDCSGVVDAEDILWYQSYLSAQITEYPEVKIPEEP